MKIEVQTNIDYKAAIAFQDSDEPFQGFEFKFGLNPLGSDIDVLLGMQFLHEHGITVKLGLGKFSLSESG